MATKWYEDERLPADLRQRMADVNEGLKLRMKDLEGDREAQLAENKRLNDETRARYLAGLEEKKAAERTKREAEEEARLAPVKRREMLQWLVDHPDRTEADFEAVWPRIKELKAIGSYDTAVEREIAAQRERGY